MNQFRYRFSQIIDQSYICAVESLPVMLFSLTFVSLMLIVEFSFHMKLVLRQDSLVPAFSTVLILREIGPVVTALLLASRLGAAMAAEIGTMRITEQLDALKLMGVNVVSYLLVPRFIGAIVASLSVTVIGVGFALLMGAFGASWFLHQPPEQFFNTMFVFVQGRDLVVCLIKALAFGAVIPVAALFFGLRCEWGSRGVGNAATRAVVQSSVVIITVDFLLTYLFN